jgi:adenosylmethionine-8-amino-7-oxononanoate aminotransferase
MSTHQSVFCIPFPPSRRFRAAPRLLGRARHEIAAVIAAPKFGSTGVLVLPRGDLERLAPIGTRHHLPLNFEEAITGFGRSVTRAR